MNIFLREQREFLIELIHGKVDFILVGGYALIFHGYVRVTGDMDVWLKPDNQNKEKFVNVLQKLGITEDSLLHIKELDFSQVVSFHIGTPPLKIDFMTSLSGLHYEQSRHNSVQFKFDEIEMPVISLKDIIVNKMLSGRLKDKADVEELQKIVQKQK